MHSSKCVIALLRHAPKTTVSTPKHFCNFTPPVPGVNLSILASLRNMEELTSKIITAYNDPTPIPLTLWSSLFTIKLNTLLARLMTVRQRWLAHDYDCLYIFAKAALAPDEPLPGNWMLHSFFRQFSLARYHDRTPSQLNRPGSAAKGFIIINTLCTYWTKTENKSVLQTLALLSR